MKNKFLIAVAFTQTLFLSSCNLGETSKLDKSLKAAIKENNCLIRLKSTTENNNKSLVLTTQCKSDSVLFFGKVLFAFVSNLDKEEVYFDNYSIQNNLNHEIISFDKNEWGIILEKKVFFDKIVNKLQNKNFQDCYDLLQNEIKSQISFEGFKSSIESALKAKYEKFEGFAFISQGGKRYISFSRTNGKNRVLITFSFDLSENAIYGYVL